MSGAAGAGQARQLEDRIRGSLYGILVGDALGCPVEGWAPGKIRRRYGVLAMMEESFGRGARPRGLHSDDGQQAIALCDAILEDPDAPAQGFVRRLVDLYRDGPTDYGLFGHHRGTGRNFRETVKKLAAGGDVYGASQPSSGNGNAMLIAPAAWYWRDDLATLSAKVIDICLVKQHHACGVASAAAVAQVVAHGVSTGSLASLEFTDLLAFVVEVETRTHERLVARGLASAPDQVFSSALRRALGLFDRRKDAALRGIEEIANETADRKVFATSGYAVASVLTSIYMALRARTLFDGVLDTVNLGGDADTTGAMVGAMVGAAFGYTGVPAEWLAELVARDAFDDRVAPMVERARGWVAARSLVELERVWTARLIVPHAREAWAKGTRPLGFDRHEGARDPAASPRRVAGGPGGSPGALDMGVVRYGPAPEQLVGDRAGPTSESSREPAAEEVADPQLTLFGGSDE
jgi:ADP-ribosylglycohydrolase